MDISTRHPLPTAPIPSMKPQNSSAIAPARDNSKKSLTSGVSSPLKIEVCPDGDFLIQLIPETKPTLTDKTAANGQNYNNINNNGQLAPNPKRPRLVQFQVSKKVLQQTSTYFQQLLKARPDLPSAVFENRGIGFGYALEVWLRAIHKGCESLPPNLKATHTERAWVAIGVGEQFGFAPHCLHKIKPWFIACFDHAMNNGVGLSPMTACCLAFPCSVFDHAEGFMKLTKYLAYHTNGNIFSHNPSQFQHLNSDARILDGPLTNARAHIQSVLDRELFFPLKKLYAANCKCRKETAFDYQAALMAMECWPIDKAVAKYPLQDIINELEKFEFTPKTAHCTSGVCKHNFTNSVQIATKKAKATFDGLCLDCMERSQADELPRAEYVMKNAPYKGCFDMGCRFGHGRTSWYFSWMGSLSVRRDILAQNRLEKPTEKTGRGHRGKRGGKRSAIRDNVTSNNIQGSASFRAAANGSDQENGHQDGDDEDEFFDAEDDYQDTDHVFPDDPVSKHEESQTPIDKF